MTHNATYYTILFAQSNPIIGERLAIGLLLFNGTDTFFNYSPTKVKIMALLLSDGGYNLLIESVRSIVSYFKDENATEEMMIEHFKNSNNLIGWAETKKIDIECNQENFLTLWNDDIRL